MPRNKRALWAATAATAALLGTALYPTSGATAAPAAHSRDKGLSDVRDVGGDYNGGKARPLRTSTLSTKARAKASAGARAATAQADAQVGDQKVWLALDDAAGPYLKTYTLRGLGNNIQVWVADDRAFPAGDCRNDLGLTEVTDAQVNSFIHEFDTNIYPAESQTFSTPPDRDGTGGADLAEALGFPADYWKVDSDQSDDIVTLVDNVRDANFTDPGTPDGQTYIAGFFYSLFNNYVDRNIMTIDAFDWLHRTGTNPPDDSAAAAYQACTTALGANRPLGVSRPHLYEGTFAHEYQHLLESYVDPDEESWVNEGLSDWAQTLVGYVNPSLAPDNPAADGHLACFQGFLGDAFGGPENSLTAWQDQGGPEILCDYGAAYSFMEYLVSHYGTAFMTALHREEGNGLAGLDAVLDQFGAAVDAQQTLHDWAAAMALDAAAKKPVKGTSRPQAFSISSMNAKINWATSQAFDTPGAPPNGSDYVRLRKSDGSFLAAKDLKSLTFDGASTLAPEPVAWTVAATPPGSTTGATTCGSVPTGPGPAALYSGCGENLDRTIARQVSVPAGGHLTFDALWDAEEGWDYGFVQVSTDGGKTWTSQSTADTTAESDPGAVSAVTSQLPGFTGDSGTWRPQSVDLSAYAGQDVLIAFRYITDPGVNEAGFWVRNIKVGDTAIPATLDGWQTYSQLNPTKVAGFTVQLVGYDGAGNAFHRYLTLNGAFHGSLSGKSVSKGLGKKATVVAAIVTYDDPSETSTKYARYALKANGVLQPGG